MNSIEAIRSGKPFQRPGMDEWFIEKDAKLISIKDGKEMDLNSTFSFDSIFFCDDWIIKG